MVDTHSHIYSEEFDDDRNFVVENAQKVGVQKVILANVDSLSMPRLQQTLTEFPNFCVSAMGLHPTSVKENYIAELQTVKENLYNQNHVAVGEIGLDLYWDDTFKNEQILAFEQQIAWALELNLPVIIHNRKAFAEVFASLHKFRKNMPKGVFHCFSGGIEEAKKAVELGFLLGIGGVVTYKNSNLGEIIAQISVENLLLETDAPYLAPVPFRGKRNEPKYLVEVLQKLSSVFAVSDEKIDVITTENACKLFKISL
ncbi:MAG: TatD family hydrolase [Prevotellaceae bacterium]|jgi:TatD DNase family protein|nr:TatD family hydrolase [Prevotellaceae bacterium]